MKIIKDIKEMQSFSLSEKRKSKRIAFVPTMGFLHEGHLSLVKTAKEHGDIVVLSIFVNKKQFGENEDFDSYPRDTVHDASLCEENNVDILFIPESDEIYPDDFNSLVIVKDLSDTMCGLNRPGHFDGVTVVVNKLFNIVQPDVAVFGQKDFQQCLVIKKMIKDLNMPISFVRSPIIREKNGLAKSSRNKYLSEEETNRALSISKALFDAHNDIKNGEKDLMIIKNKISERLKENNAEIDYIVFKNPEDLSDSFEFKGSLLIAVAAKFGSTRLIDNILIEN